MPFNKWWSKSEIIKAVHDNDLSNFLISIGILDDINNGHFRCLNCDRVINIDNIGAILPYHNKIIITCEQITCLLNLNSIQKV